MDRIRCRTSLPRERDGTRSQKCEIVKGSGGFEKTTNRGFCPSIDKRVSRCCLLCQLRRLFVPWDGAGLVGSIVQYLQVCKGKPETAFFIVKTDAGNAFWAATGDRHNGAIAVIGVPHEHPLAVSA